MRATERLALTEEIGAELQRLYTFSDIEAFFAAMGISTGDHDWGSSKRVYVKEVLQSASAADVLRVATEIGLAGHSVSRTSFEPPANWRDTDQFRLFISHISKDKTIATRLKEALAPFSISGFVAHEDIHPTLAWQDEIERALHSMDGFVGVHTKGFRDSIWTQQEIGFALGRGTKIISFKYGEDPVGFIGKHQALPRRDRNAEQIASEINTLLMGDARTADRLKGAQAKRGRGGVAS